MLIEGLDERGAIDNRNDPPAHDDPDRVLHHRRDRHAIVAIGRRLQRGEEHVGAPGYCAGLKVTVIVIGTSTATQFSSVGVNSHCRIALAAASSRSGFVADVV